MARIDYDQEATRYRAGRHVPLEQLEPWRPVVGELLPPRGEPLLDVGAGTGLWARAFVSWFGAEVVALEPSSGMRRVGTEIGLPASARYVAASGEHLPFPGAMFRAAWLSTVVHHLTDLAGCAGELRRVLVEGGAVLIRGSFPGRDEEVELFRHFPASRVAAASWPTLEQVVLAFTDAGFTGHRVVRVREGRWRDLRQVRDFAVAMRHTDSALAPVSDADFAAALKSLEAAIARGERPRPEGIDLVVLT